MAYLLENNFTVFLQNNFIYEVITYKSYTDTDKTYISEMINTEYIKSDKFIGYNIEKYLKKGKIIYSKSAELVGATTDFINEHKGKLYEYNPKTGRKKENPRRKQSINPEIGQLLVDQIARELHNHAIYRTFANYYALKSLELLEKYWIDRAEEEIEHHRWIVNRLNYCDVPFSYPSTPAVEEDIENDIYPFSRTVDLEIETTEWITKIVDAARDYNDWETFYWLQSTLINEQVEEESISRTALDIASMEDASWLRKSKEIIKLLKD